MKRCPQCGKEKQFIDFNYNSASPDGYYGWCRDCVKLYRKRYNKNPPRRKSKMSGMKICTKCDKEKSLIDFNVRQTIHGSYQSWCRDCQKKYRQKYNHHHNHLQYKFGISEAQYELILKSQNEVCAICGQPETMKRNGSKVQPLSVDHCHKTSKIRGLLCSNCNKALGGFKDDPELLRKAINYLEVSK